MACWQLVCHIRAQLLFDSSFLYRSGEALSLAMLHCQHTGDFCKAWWGDVISKADCAPLSDTEGTGPNFGTWDSDSQCQITTALSSPIFPCLVSSEPNA